jgi:hypothetical protein
MMLAKGVARDHADREFKPSSLRAHPIQMDTMEAILRKAAATDLKFGMICVDRDGNSVRIDRVDQAAGTLSYNFLNDELRVQEGIQQPSIEQFLTEGWYVSAKS